MHVSVMDKETSRLCWGSFVALDGASDRVGRPHAHLVLAAPRHHASVRLGAATAALFVALVLGRWLFAALGLWTAGAVVGLAQTRSARQTGCGERLAARLLIKGE